MPEMAITIWFEEINALVPEDKADLDALDAAPEMSLAQLIGNKAPMIKLTPLDGNLEPVGESFALPFPEPMRMETPNESGRMQWALTRLPLNKKVAIDNVPAYLRVAVDGWKQVFRWSEVTDAIPDSNDIRTTAMGGTGRTLVLVSEMFDSWEPFHQACKELHEYILTKPPFTDPDVRGNFGIEAIFARPSSGDNFKTIAKIKELEKKQDRRIYGDSEKVKEFVRQSKWDSKQTGSDKKREGQMVLVLVNYPKRGGAGGSISGQPAWISITNGDNETWQDVALHELGHSFGLADEYTADAAGMTFPKEKDLEPNITLTADPARTPWRDLLARGALTDEEIMAAPTLRRENAGDYWQDKARYKGVVGTFEGARYYEKKIFRPTIDCCMRNTAVDFCPVCQRVIRDAVTGAKEG